VKGTPLHFIVDRGSQKNLISAEVIKQLGLSTTPHPQPYNIGWLRQGRDLVSANKCRFSYDIQPFKDEVLCDVSPLDVCDVLLGQPYMWKCHVIYESRPRSVIVTLGGHLYRIPEVVLTIVPPKQCRKVISHTTKFSLFTICSKGEQKDTATTASLGPRPFFPTEADCRRERRYCFLHLQWYLHTAQSSQDTTGWLNIFNPSNNRFVTTFNKLSNTTSLARQATHQDSDSTNTFPSPLGTQRNGDHFFLRRED
jgi:hypothetical protein